NFSYHVKWNAISAQTAWRPGSEPFPLALGAEATQAGAFLASSKQITNGLALGQIDIHRIALPKSLVGTNTDAIGYLTNQWYTEFSFYNPKDIQSSRSFFRLMLLDGTKAEEDATNTYGIPAKELQAQELNQRGALLAKTDETEFEKTPAEIN